MKIQDTKEYKRLKIGADEALPPWKRWGPYVSNRSWGTVREDYSPDGNAWDFFTHEQARSKAYRWGEDAIAGFCDRYQVMVLGWSFWNGKDPILKERLFGLSSSEGNHGEDVKEYYYYLDSTPTFSYAKFLYKYPINAFPYQMLLEENKKRGLKDREYELIDTKIFDEDEYFDIYVEYAKNEPDDICVKIEVFNRSDKPAPFHLIPQVIFRNQWSWKDDPLPKPKIEEIDADGIFGIVANDSDLISPTNLAFDYHLKERYFYAPDGGNSLFTNNESNKELLWNEKSDTPFVKDAFHRKIINQEEGAVNPEKKGTKAAIHYSEEIAAKSSKVFLFRLNPQLLVEPLKDVENIVSIKKSEADEYYQSLQPLSGTDEEKKIQRQAFAGMLWSEQIYLYDVSAWIMGDSAKFPLGERSNMRNTHWRHLNSMRIFSMPDKWEYPWFAAWDLAFQATTLAYVDLDLAKSQLWLLLFDQFQHPNGQIPAYEWEFSDVNPPVQAWAALKIFNYEKETFGREDKDFLEKCFHKLLLNFSWWVNKIDASGKNVFEGGFLGLDNITVIDRSERSLAGKIDEADGAGWMAMFCFNLMEIALTLSETNKIYESLATKFFEHYVYIAAALRKGYWRAYDMLDNKDFFFYSVITHEDGNHEQFRIRSLVGIIPLFACGALTGSYIDKFKLFKANFTWFCKNRKHLTDKCIETVDREDEKKHLFSLLDASELEKFLKYIWDPNEFRSEYGLRSFSKFHENNPYSFRDKSICYEPGESLASIKGGNSNWRGPIWLPASFLLIEALKVLDFVLEDDLSIRVEGEEPVTINEMIHGFVDRLISLFEKNKEGNRPIYGDYKKMQEDPNFQDHLLFYEHYHGDTGRGLGASHQTGWSGLIANIIQEYRS